MKSFAWLFILASFIFINVPSVSFSAKAVKRDSPIYSIGSVDELSDLTDLANSVAMHLQMVYEDRDDIFYMPVYIIPPNSTQISLYFANLLKTHIVNRGMRVSEHFTENSVPLSFTIQKMEPHIIAGAKDAFNPEKLTNEQDYSDILFTINLTYNNKYVMNFEAEGRINNKNSSLYAGPQGIDPSSGTFRSLSIIGR